MSKAQMWVLNNLNRTMVYGLTIAALVLVTFGASAQTADEKVCYTSSGDPAIEACNRVDQFARDPWRQPCGRLLQPLRRTGEKEGTWFAHSPT